MNRNTFQQLLRTHKNRVFSHAYYCLRNRADAEDVTQEAFLRLWQRCPEEDEAGIRSWLMRVVHNLCVDHSRRRKTRSGTVNVPDPAALDAMSSSEEGKGNPEHQFESTQNRQALLEALSKLPEKTRSMMLLHYFEGMDYETVGTALQTNVNTVKVAVHRGRKMLRSLLAARYEDRLKKSGTAGG